MALCTQPRLLLGPQAERPLFSARSTPSRTRSSRLQPTATLAGDNGTPATPTPPATPPQTPQSRVIGANITGITTPRLSNRGPAEPAPEGYHFGGALTTQVFGAALLSERLNGVGIVENLELHNKGFHPVLLFAVGALLCAAAWPERAQRESNPSTMVRVQMAGARLAYLGLAGTIAAEMFTGKGILALADVETGIEALSDIEAVVAFAAMLFLTGPQAAKSPKIRK